MGVTNNIKMGVTNKINTISDVNACDKYIKDNDLRRKYGNRSDGLWYEEGCYVKWASCLMMFDEVKSPSCKVVDLGVGSSPICHIIADQGFDVIGVDLNTVNHPYQSLAVMVLKDAMEFLHDYKDESVDIFLDTCSVTHFNFTNDKNYGWESVFKAVKRILKPGGYFLVSSDIRFDKNTRGTGPAGEFICPEEIVKTAEDCGLTITSEVEYNKENTVKMYKNEYYGLLGVATFCFRKKVRILDYHPAKPSELSPEKTSKEPPEETLVEPPFDTSAYQNYLKTMKISSLPNVSEIMKTSSLPNVSFNYQKHYGIKERQELCKDLEHLCSEDATILEEIIDEYVYLLKDKRIEEMKEFVKKELSEEI